MYVIILLAQMLLFLTWINIVIWYDLLTYASLIEILEYFDVITTKPPYISMLSIQMGWNEVFPCYHG